MDEALIRDYIASYLKKNVPEMIKREIKIENITGKATVIIGPRRAGKTYLLWQEISKYPRSKALYLDLEDIAFAGLGPGDALRVIREIFTEVSGESAEVIFLDEIQNVEGWQGLVRSLLDRGYMLFITGSSSKLLSREIATELRGRSLPFLLLPFSFREFLLAKGYTVDKNSLEDAGKARKLLRKYLEFGGYPEVVLNPEHRERILADYRDMIFFKDFVERQRIRSIEVGRFIFTFVTQAFSSEISYRSVLKSLKSAGVRFGKNTVYEYINRLQDTMAFFLLDRYSTKVKLRSGWPRKVYLADTGLAWRLPYDGGRLAENVVFLELKRRQKPGSEIYYYRDAENHEVDFLIKDGPAVSELIQVTLASAKREIKDSEIDNLITASKLLRCSTLSVITWDYDSVETVKAGKQIRFVPLWKWLTE
ncbi:MAG: ATP-binding protein [Nitrososphaerota archaeon]|jgi:predicted AAA+ superfamily ATPase|nr:ATP-binding protein [Nitrososphaerota archaeon]MDG6936504.1 ATP-binding protein [Nitrososphaerota archaeon]MDG6944979.1 ATP-binding protein [Nitrososphaerota archaeon]